MSAPAGWHLQPDGRERYWDGAQWTEQFRVPAPTEPMDPTAPPPPSSWTPTVDETQVLDVPGTQAMPQAQPAPPSSPGSTPAPGASHGSAGPPAYPSPEPAAYPAPQQYSYPSGAGGLPPAGPPGSGYGAPGGQWQAPPRSGTSGLAKGCLFAALGVALLVGIAVVAAIFFISRAAEEVVDNLPSTFPTELPSGLPTDLPSGVPTEGLGDRIEIAVGNGFELPRAVIQDGWSLEAQGGGVPIVQVRGMRATLEDGDGFPVLFTMSVPGDGGEVETVCTAAGGSSGATVDVSCVPFFGDVSDATRATVTATL